MRDTQLAENLVLGRADRWLLASVLPADCEAARVAQGERDTTVIAGDSLGGAVYTAKGGGRNRVEKGGYCDAELIVSI